MIGGEIEHVDVGPADDIISAGATRALAASLLVGSLVWIGALTLLIA